MPDSEVIEGDVVEVTSSNVPAVYVEPPRGLARTADPIELVALAAKMADALVDLVNKKKLYAEIHGKKYPNVEAWLTIARMDNVVAREHGLPVRHDDGSYEAEVDLIRLSDGMVVGHGSAICGTADDPPWNARTATAKRGMAVTRATSRACRQHYAWIMAMAGYEPTPAEDMPEDDHPHQPVSGQGAPAAPRAVPSATPAPATAPGASTAGTEAGDIQIVVSEKPEDAVRIVRDAHRDKRWEGERHKLEVVGKVGNRKHTAIILGELADGAAAFGINVGDVVILRGAHVEEITWAEDKPPKKEVWGNPPDYLMADVLVGRDGEWVSVREAAPTLGMTDTNADPTSTPTTPSTTSGSPAPATTPPATSTGGSTEAVRKQGTVGEYEALEVRLTQPIQRTLRGQTLVAIIRGVDERTGELVMAGLAEDIDDMIGPEDAPWLTEGDVARMYGVWRPNGWYVVDTVGKKP